MADDLGDKTEAPTPRRRAESRKKGQVAKSQDLPAATLLLGGLIAMLFVGPGLWRGLIRVMQLGLGAEGLTRAGDLPQLAATMTPGVFKSIGLLMLILFVIAVIMQYVQVGFLLTLTPLTPNLGKLNPITGLKRLFSARKTVELLINLAKLALVCAVAYVTIMGFADRVLFSASATFPTMFPMAWDLVFRLGIRLGLVMFILALFDYAYQRYRHEKDLKMTKQEVKEELKSMEGDPVLKRRRRQVQMQLALQRIGKDVPQADVVVTNPHALRRGPQV